MEPQGQHNYEVKWKARGRGTHFGVASLRFETPRAISAVHCIDSRESVELRQQCAFIYVKCINLVGLSSSLLTKVLAPDSKATPFSFPSV